MSGIFGFVNTASSDVQEEVVRRLMLWNRPYGEEGEESFYGDGFAVGCCYEKLSDTAAKSTPVLKKNGMYAVIDALLFNREELLMQGQFLPSLSDEELLLSYIEKFGMDALRQVNGNFAGAIYDMSKKTLVLFRDHMGVRPLFYTVNEGMIAFSTELRGLISLPQTNVEISEKWLMGVFVGDANPGTESTEFSNIFCVKPAGYMTFSFDGQVLRTQKSVYWKLGSQKIRFSSEKEYQNRLRELITDSIKIRLDAVPGLVGAELSGGLDSAVIDILINRLGRECIYYSWSASPQEVPLAEGDERLIIDDICKQEGISCNYGKRNFQFNSENVIAEKMRKTGMQINDSDGFALRFALPPYVNTFQVCETAEYMQKQGVKVIFTGHGGDEGVSNRSNPYELFYHKEYYRYLKQMWSTTHGEKGRVKKTVKKCFDNLNQTRKLLKSPYKSPIGVPELLCEDIRKRNNEKTMSATSFAYDVVSYIEAGGSRNRLDVVAFFGAYSGVRYVMPYLDYRVIDFAVSIPRYLYLRGKINRFIFRETFKDIIPTSLYRLRIKADNSWKNTQKKPKNVEAETQKRRDVVALLDREYWSKYLNFDVIDKWVEQKEEIEDEIRDKGCWNCIAMCVRFQNVIDKSRDV